MLLQILRMTFESLIGRVDPEKKDELRARFDELLTEAVKAAAAGAVQGAMSNK